MIESIVDAAIDGLEKAVNDHYSFSRKSGYYSREPCYPKEQRSPWMAPEYFFTVYVCRQIRCIESAPYVDIEDSVEAIMHDAGGWGPGRIGDNVRRDGKIDIILSDRDHAPFAIAEVKVVSAPNEVWKDSERICGILRRNNGIQHGILALVVSGQSESQTGLLGCRIKNFKGIIPTYAPNFKVTSKVKCLDLAEDGRSYAAMVFRISRR